MSLNILCTPKIYIGNNAIGFKSFYLTNTGNNQINTCNITITGFRDNTKLFKEEVRVYLNENDGSPIFRGFIKSITTSDNKMQMTALDPRYLLTGQEGIPINITDENNYDGYSISQFLIHYIDTYINTDRIYLATDYISDTAISSNMNTIRGMQNDIYGMLTSTLTNKINDTDIDNLHRYIISMEDDGLRAQIVIEEEKPLSSIPSLTLSQYDGISKITSNKRVPPNYGISFTEEGNAGVYQHGNMPSGRINDTGSSNFKSTAEATYASMINILSQVNDTQKITVQVTRGFYIKVGSIVRLDVEDFDIRGNHRVTSKTISFDGNNMSCSLGLNRKPVTLKKYTI